MVETATQPLAWHDMQHCLRRAPVMLLAACKKYGAEFMVAGGYVRSCVAGEDVNDIDCFTSSKAKAFQIACYIIEADAENKSEIKAFIRETDNAFTITKFKRPVQIVHRWTFKNPVQAIESFDFTISRGAFWYERIVKIVRIGDADVEVEDEKSGWRSVTDGRFYQDLAAKRLVYTMPQRNEDAGGSMLRVLKYYQRGYRMPIDSLGAVMARLMMGVRYRAIEENDEARWHTPLQVKLGAEITRLLHEVDPDLDPKHIAHLPAMNQPFQP